MKIREATWECENLGLDVVEIEFDPGEQCLDPAALPRIEKADYVLARVPVGQTELIHRLEEDRFRFLATQCSLAIDGLHQLDQPAFTKSICRHVESREVTEDEELEQIVSRIDSEMFDTDRISMDPRLSDGHALQRHQYIVRALFADRRNVCRGLYLRDELIGFFQLQYRSDQHYFASLAGVFSSFKGSGLGIAAIWLPVQWAAQNQVQRLSTSNSTNNPGSVRMHLAVGYGIESFHYVLRRMN